MATSSHRPQGSLSSSAAKDTVSGDAALAPAVLLPAGSLGPSLNHGASGSPGRRRALRGAGSCSAHRHSQELSPLPVQGSSQKLTVTRRARVPTQRLPRPWPTWALLKGWEIPRLTSVAQVKLLPGLLLLAGPLNGQHGLLLCLLTGGFRTVRAGECGPLQGVR